MVPSAGLSAAVEFTIACVAMVVPIMLSSLGLEMNSLWIPTFIAGVVSKKLKSKSTRFAIVRASPVVALMSVAMSFRSPLQCHWSIAVEYGPQTF